MKVNFHGPHPSLERDCRGGTKEMSFQGRVVQECRDTKLKSAPKSVLHVPKFVVLLIKPNVFGFWFLTLLLSSLPSSLLNLPASFAVRTRLAVQMQSFFNIFGQNGRHVTKFYTVITGNPGSVIVPQYGSSKMTVMFAFCNFFNFRKIPIFKAQKLN